MHPQQRRGSYLNIENRIKNKAKVLEKRFGRNKRSNYICAPLKWEQVLRQIEQVETPNYRNFTWKAEKINFLKNFSKTLVRLEKRLYFCTRFQRHTMWVKRNEKQEEHVPRHIELTAVLTEMLEQKNKSNRIERFEKTDRIGVA